MNSGSIQQEATLYQRIGGEPALRRFVKRLYDYMNCLPEVKPIRNMHAMPLEEAGERLFHLRAVELPAVRGAFERAGFVDLRVERPSLEERFLQLTNDGVPA